MKPYRQQTGVSMIEVLIAILVSAIGLFSAMKLRLTAVSNTHSAYFRSQAALITNALVDQMRANPTGAVAGNYDITLTGSVPGSGGMEVADLGQWRADLVASLPNATGSVACVAATRVCSLVVQWDDSRGLSGAGAQQFTMNIRLP
ncbi:MAG: type IV pilus modification protein PilV [Porticoccaceae bacterium]